MNDLGRVAYVYLFAEIGIALFITVLVGILAGYWLDQRLGTLPIFALVGFAVGLTAGAVGSWRLLSRFLARFDEMDKR